MNGIDSKDYISAVPAGAGRREQHEQNDTQRCKSLQIPTHTHTRTYVTKSTKASVSPCGLCDQLPDYLKECDEIFSQ